MYHRMSRPKLGNTSLDLIQNAMESRGWYGFLLWQVLPTYFGRYHASLDLIQNAMESRGWELARVDGKLPSDQRQARVDESRGGIGAGVSGALPFLHFFMHTSIRRWSSTLTCGNHPNMATTLPWQPP